MSAVCIIVLIALVAICHLHYPKDMSTFEFVATLGLGLSGICTGLAIVVGFAAADLKFTFLRRYLSNLDLRKIQLVSSKLGVTLSLSIIVWCILAIPFVSPKVVGLYLISGLITSALIGSLIVHTRRRIRWLRDDRP